jgi:hypothetical protein
MIFFFRDIECSTKKNKKTLNNNKSFTTNVDFI